MNDDNKSKKIALHFILLLGIVSLFGDVTYEGARSVTGPYLALLGASGRIVGFVAGLGELLGYTLRLASGYFVDRARSYWLPTFVGYGLLFSIPFLALAPSWKLAVILILLERLGKAIRTPARDAILSHATKQIGRGLGFGLHEALDQAGAIIGPLIFSTVFFLKFGYREGFAMLSIPAVLTIGILVIAKLKVATPENLEITNKIISHKIDKKLPKIFWSYSLFIFLTVLGMSNFQLLSYHFKAKVLIKDTDIPLFYIVAMGIDALAALAVGKLYDRFGLSILAVIPVLTIPISIFGFSFNKALILLGMIIFGGVLGVHETIMRAAIADLTPMNKRGLAYGIFNAIYGLSWFLGGTILGFLYELSLHYLILFVLIMEILSLMVFLFNMKTFLSHHSF